MRRRRRPVIEKESDYRNNALIEAFTRGFVFKSEFSPFQDNSCTVNYQGRLYEGFLVGYSQSKESDKFLIYIQNIEFGSDGSESELTYGSAFRGGINNHVWCSIAVDPEVLLKKSNTLYVNADYGRLRREAYLYIDICTWNALEAKYGNAENKIRDGLYNLFCEKSVLFAQKHAIRHLDLDEED